MCCKKLIFNVLLGELISFFKLFKNAVKPERRKILKNYGHFRIPHPQISLKRYVKI